MEDYSTTHLKEAAKIIPLIDAGKIESMVTPDLRRAQPGGGRIFFLGWGEAPRMPLTRSMIFESSPASSRTRRRTTCPS